MSQSLTVARYAEWLGCALGVFGATLLAMNTDVSGYGFVAFLASNCCWIVFGYIRSAPGLLLMQTAFTATSLLGIYRWFG